MDPEHHSNFEYQTSTDRQTASAPRPARTESQPAHGQAREAALADELSPAEQEEKDKALQQANAALASIWATLRQHPGKPAAADTREAIDSTMLRELKPVYKAQLERVIAARKPPRPG